MCLRWISVYPFFLFSSVSLSPASVRPVPDSGSAGLFPGRAFSSSSSPPFPPLPSLSSPPQSLSFLSNIPAGSSVSCDVMGWVCVCVFLQMPSRTKTPSVQAPHPNTHTHTHTYTHTHTHTKNIHPVAPHSSLPVSDQALSFPVLYVCRSPTFPLTYSYCQNSGVRERERERERQAGMMKRWWLKKRGGGDKGGNDIFFCHRHCGTVDSVPHEG